jgi:hypothetical protein
MCSNSGCGSGSGDPSLNCTPGQGDIGCNIPGYPVYVNAHCNCCLPDWNGCATSAQCCNSAGCDQHTYKCGVDCSTACGGLPVCTCQCLRDWQDPNGECNASPILVNVANNGSDHLTSALDGVSFDIDADGTPEQVAWTSADSSVAFLVWDRNRNGVIDNGSEFFGTATRLRDGTLAGNGFDALREWDGNRDNRIDSVDPIYSNVRLWFDSNHNGYSDSDELWRLQTIGITTILCDYVESARRDQFGNRYRYEGIALMLSHKEQVVRRIFDVFFEVLR